LDRDQVRSLSRRGCGEVPSQRNYGGPAGTILISGACPIRVTVGITVTRGIAVTRAQPSHGASD
jgi:hypothetical protein